MDLSGEHQRSLLNLARRTIRATLAGDPVDSRADGAKADGPDDPALHQRCGCFVSLHEVRTHRLRGCVGRIDARDPLLLGVRDAAAAVLRDPRFVQTPVTLNELPLLEIEITVCSPLSEAPHVLAFEPLAHGIYLTVGTRGGCFLPQVARETGWSRRQLLERLCTEKLQLAADAWEFPAARLHTFLTQIIGPEAFVDVG